MLDSLSPPRRRLVFALCGLAAVALLLIAGLVGARISGGDDAADGAAADVRQDRPGPVLLVPGYGGSTESLAPLQATLSAAGRHAILVQVPDGGEGDLREQAKALDDAVSDAMRDSDAGSVDVVGYSAGGVVARIWAQELGGSDVARRIITLGSPHHGTDLAELAQRLAPSLCLDACKQLVPGSDLLESLNRDETPAGPVYIAMWTANDQTVSPPESGRLDGATNIELQGVCADSTVQHGALPRDPLVQGLVLRELSADPVLVPTPGDCASLRAA